MNRLIRTYIAEIFFLTDDGIFPNNKTLPVVHYKKVLKLPSVFGSSFIKNLFEENGWKNSWKDGIFSYQHYHSNTHEVLGAYNGKAKIQLGGDRGKEILFEKGDVLIIPAGVAHKNLGDEDDVKVVGAYPDGLDYDLNYGKPGERPGADENIKAVPLPKKDPVFGSVGELKDHWQ